jgi:signal transduction histidine kinase
MSEDVPVNILLVDDRPENLFALEELVRHPSRVVYTASSGNDALRLVLKHEFALVLLDVEMPGMDGYETAALMRGAARSRTTPIIFVTAGDPSEERVFRGYDAGGVDFLYKPVNAHVLRSKVAIFVELYKKSRALEASNAELQRTTKELRERIADLEYVHQTLSHDLRAPLRAIQGFVQVLREDFPDAIDGSAKDALERIMRASGAMTNMIDDLYELLRDSSIPTELAHVDIATVLPEVIESIRPALEQAGGTVTTGALPVVRANRRLLEQILQNLLLNSLKFRGDAAPAIHVAVETTPACWEVAVRDNGIGIPPAERERVFRLFTRLGQTPGTGVGLTLCKRAVEKLGGRIWVGSEPGPGTTFHFTIPRA